MMVVDDADLTWTSKRIGACNAQLESHGRRLSLATVENSMRSYVQKASTLYHCYTVRTLSVRLRAKGVPLISEISAERADQKLGHEINEIYGAGVLELASITRLQPLGGS